MTDQNENQPGAATAKPTSPAIEILAGKMYAAYCAAVGGVAFNGEPLPEWDAFRADTTKQKQSDAWIAAAGVKAPKLVQIPAEKSGASRAIEPTVIGDLDAFKTLIHTATENGSDTLAALQVPGGCLVRTSARGPRGASEALAFVPTVTIAPDVNGGHKLAAR